MAKTEKQEIIDSLTSRIEDYLDDMSQDTPIEDIDVKDLASDLYTWEIEDIIEEKIEETKEECEEEFLEKYVENTSNFEELLENYLSANNISEDRFILQKLRIKDNSILAEAKLEWFKENFDKIDPYKI